MHYLIFILALLALLTAAKFFTKSAEVIGTYLGLPSFVIGVFIVGIGTSLPELIAGIIAVKNQSSEILSGNIIGANISNILLITGLAVVVNRKNIVLNSGYLYIDLHFLIGSFLCFYTIASLETIALSFSIPKSIIALTLLSLGTTLPELAVNISAIKQGKAEMAIGNVLGSSIFNTLVIPATASFFGPIMVPENLIQFSLPVMAACGLMFYLLAQDKKISVWEGLMFICLYGLFIFKTATG